MEALLRRWRGKRIRGPEGCGWRCMRAANDLASRSLSPLSKKVSSDPSKHILKWLVYWIIWKRVLRTRDIRKKVPIPKGCFWAIPLLCKTPVYRPNLSFSCRFSSSPNPPHATVVSIEKPASSSRTKSYDTPIKVKPEIRNMGFPSPIHNRRRPLPSKQFFPPYEKDGTFLDEG